MELKKAFGAALKRARTVQLKTQEDFGIISSRTYLSALERGVYSPTIDKLDALSSVLGLHPLTLLGSTYLNADPDLDIDDLLVRLGGELKVLHNRGS